MIRALGPQQQSTTTRIRDFDRGRAILKLSLMDSTIFGSMIHALCAYKIPAACAYTNLRVSGHKMINATKGRLMCPLRYPASSLASARSKLGAGRQRRGE